MKKDDLCTFFLQSDDIKITVEFANCMSISKDELAETLKGFYNAVKRFDIGKEEIKSVADRVKALEDEYEEKRNNIKNYTVIDEQGIVSDDQRQEFMKIRSNGRTIDKNQELIQEIIKRLEHIEAFIGLPKKK